MLQLIVALDRDLTTRPSLRPRFALLGDELGEPGPLRLVQRHDRLTRTRHPVRIDREERQPLQPPRVALLGRRDDRAARNSRDTEDLQSLRRGLLPRLGGPRRRRWRPQRRPVAKHSSVAVGSQHVGARPRQAAEAPHHSRHTPSAIRWCRMPVRRSSSRATVIPSRQRRPRRPSPAAQVGRCRGRYARTGREPSRPGSTRDARAPARRRC